MLADIDRRWQVMRQMLVATFILQLAGQVWTAWTIGTVWSETLWYSLKVEDAAARWCDRLVCLSVVLAVACALGLQHRRSPSRLLVSLGFAWAGLWFLFLSCNGAYQGGEFASAYQPFAEAGRFGLAWVLAYLAYTASSLPRTEVVTWMIRLALASVFAVHGFEAWFGHPEFVDFLLRVPQRYFGLSLSEDEALLILRLIACQDLGLALAALVWPVRGIFAYMAFCGLLTAVVRTFYSPAYGLPLTLVRMSHAGLPLSLWLVSPSLPLSRAQRRDPSLRSG